MIKVALGLLAIGIAAMPFVDKGAELEKVAVAYRENADIEVVGPNQMVFTVASQTGAACKIVSTFDHYDQQIVVSERACADVYTGLERVTYWSATDNGDVVLKDANGNTILRIEPSDGFAYEAVNADGAQITFVLSDV